jgi:sulfur carrier protein
LLYVEICLNGDPQAVADGATVADLLRSLGVGKRRVAVELNRDIVPREAYATTLLKSGDAVEVVHFVGGG